MKLSEEMREIIVEHSEHFSPEGRSAVIIWIMRVERLERGRLGRLWHEIVCYWEDFMNAIGIPQ